MWDESVIEKPESIALEGLCAVRSSKARRLKPIKPGYYHPPGGPPIFVPGMNWLAVLLLGRQGPPVLAAMKWWTTRGLFAQTGRELETGVLDAWMATWGRRLLHIFDPGFAGSPWLGLCFERSLRFLLRWPKDYKPRDGQGNKRKAWQITRGKRSWAQRQVWGGRRKQWFQAGVLAVPVQHPEYDQALWLVYAFLLTFLDEASEGLRTRLLRSWCHRRGKRCREATTPLYRIPWALSRLWLAHPPLGLSSRLLNSG